MNEYKYHYLFTSFDIESFDMEDFKYNFVNITAFRLVDVNDIAVKELLKDMERYYSEQNINVFNKSRIIEVSSLVEII
jgi:ionotropic kainate glutamate receptor 2